MLNVDFGACEHFVVGQQPSDEISPRQARQRPPFILVLQAHLRRMRRQRFLHYADNIAKIGEAIERGRRNGTNPGWILEYRNRAT